MATECEKMKEQLSLYRDGRLTEVEQGEVEAHLLTCPECIFMLTLVPAFHQD